MLLANIPAELLEKAKAAQSLVDLKSMAEAEGIEATDEQITLLWRELSGHEDTAELADDELENIAGGCGPKEYNVGGNWNPVCPDQKDYKRVRRVKRKEKTCGDCEHFRPNTTYWDGPGKCRRELDL